MPSPGKGEWAVGITFLQMLSQGPDLKSCLGFKHQTVLFIVYVMYSTSVSCFKNWNTSKD